jgi:hypothetical protein
MKSWKSRQLNDSEVWKAQAVDSKELFALKKILMHNEKEGVQFLSIDGVDGL